ncbi:mechanosensitive ion channel family protein [Microbispora sp. H11081]|uniref:mechanosensitive ion channel family protein n=1 Tax=Microbispora sp. H11081 TaxID=2729107 RepID=UPI002898EF39|nr:mechanosensitive ion channel family protein [Microbispora sp. H11081]
MLPLSPVTPGPEQTVVPDPDVVAAKVSAACANNEGIFCTVLNSVFPERDFPAWVQLLGGIVDVLLLIALIMAGALIVRNVVHRLITRVTVRASVGVLPERLRGKAVLTSTEAATAIMTERRRARAETMGSVLRSLASVVVLGTAALMIFAKLGIAITPLLTSIGILGVAVGFGAQELVKDFIAGMFMLLEDQYGVGDVIDTGVAVGTVEAVTLRITRLRDADGKVWYVRNGTITRVGNESQGWSRAVVDVPVPYDSDVATVRELLTGIATDLWEDPEFRDTIVVEEPQVFGLESMSGSSVIFRVSAKTVPARHLEVARELRLRVKRAFDEKSLTFAS